MQKMAIFQRFSRTFRENSLLAKAMNNFTIGGGDLMAYPQAKSGNGTNVFNAIAAESKNAGKVAAQRGSYLANCSKSPEAPLCFRGERHQYFHTSRYNNFGLFAPLGGEQTVALLPVHARRFYRREKGGTKTRTDMYGKSREHHKRIFREAKDELKRKINRDLYELPHPLRVYLREKTTNMNLNIRDQKRMYLAALKAAVMVKIVTSISMGKTP